MIESIALGVFVFIALSVAGWRALDAIAAKRAADSAQIVRNARALARRESPDYRGPVYNAHGREVTSR